MSLMDEQHPISFPEDSESQTGYELTRRHALMLLSLGGLVAVAGLGAGVGSVYLLQEDPEPKEIIPDIKHELDKSGLRKRAGQVISTFENSTTEIQYGYAEDIGDGRGITAGPFGATSGTGDLLEVDKRLAEIDPTDPLVGFLPALEEVNGSDSTEGLDGFIETWEQSAKGAALRSALDAVYDEWYFDPALRIAEEAGLTSDAGNLIILDTIVQHGEGDDPDGLPAIMNEVIAKQGTATIDNEKQWLIGFLETRREHLMHAADPATREGWRESVDRVRALFSILEQDMTLMGPLAWTVYGDPFDLPAVE